MRQIAKEFKAFTLKGNVFDLAVGVMIGGAFGKVIQSLVDDIMMPPIGLLLKKVNFSDMFISINGQHYASLSQAKEAAAPTINYGQFITEIMNLAIVAGVLFIVIKKINHLRKQNDTSKQNNTKTKICSQCFSEIPVLAKRCKYCTSPVSSLRKSA
jgi:large conductance mechanosensitive channel